MDLHANAKLALSGRHLSVCGRLRPKLRRRLRRSISARSVTAATAALRPVLDLGKESHSIGWVASVIAPATRA